MKRIIITSTKFQGEVICIYAETLLLVSIDFLNTDLSAEQRAWFKGRIPAKLFAEFHQCFQGVPVDVVMEGYEITFEMFWEAYNEKINRERCLKRWNGMSKADRQKAYAGVAAYDRHLARQSWGKNKANPDTYLRDKYWNNEWK